MTTTSEKILSEMERMGNMNINTLCDKMGWQYQKFHRRMALPGKFSDKELQLIADSMNALQKYLPKTSVEALRGDTRTIRTSEEYAQDYCRQCPMHHDDQCGYVTRHLQSKCDRLALVTEGYEAGIEEVRRALPE